MANPEHVEIVKQGAEAIDAWRKENPATLLDLKEANLHEANLPGANLTGANLSEASLLCANLGKAELGGAELVSAYCGETAFTNLDLSTVIGLDSIMHVAPSSIGIDTVFMSGGKIPAAFLRGCGVPDALIEYLASSLGSMNPDDQTRI